MSEKSLAYRLGAWWGQVLPQSASRPPSQTPGDFHGYAGFLKRVAAVIVDAVIVSIPFSIVAGVFGSSFGARMSDDVSAAVGATLMAKLIGLAMAWVYFAAMESSQFQGTIGKLALGIKVTDTVGNRITFGRATGRFVGRIISAIIFGLGFIMVAFTAKRQGLHDIMADCLVVNK